MNHTDYARHRQQLLDAAAAIENSKRPGYTGGSEDVLANFKGVAAKLGLTPEQAWGVYFLKHIDAILSIMTKPDLPVSEAPEGRFADAINYLKLGWALLQERSPQQMANKEAPALSSSMTASTFGRGLGASYDFLAGHFAPAGSTETRAYGPYTPKG